MFSIYQLFAHLVKYRCQLREVRRFWDLPLGNKSFAYKNFDGFPNLAMQYQTSWPPYGGELVGILESNDFSIPRFVSHIPTAVISLDALPQETANHIRREIKALYPETVLPALHEVYYLLHGKRENRTKVCLVHGSFFATNEPEKLIQQALAQVVSECLEDNEWQVMDSDAIIELARTLSREVFSSRARSAPNASVSIRIEVDANVIDSLNILNSCNFPAIESDTLSFVVPFGLDAEFRDRIFGLGKSLLKSDWRYARKMIIRHPFNGDFFVLSFAL